MVLVNWWFVTLHLSESIARQCIFESSDIPGRQSAAQKGLKLGWFCMAGKVTSVEDVCPIYWQQWEGQFSLLPLKPNGGQTWSMKQKQISAPRKSPRTVVNQSESCEAVVWVKSSQCQVPPPARVYLKSWEGFSTSQAINEIPKIHLCCVQLVLHHFSCPNMSGWFHSLNAAIGDSFQAAPGGA